MLTKTFLKVLDYESYNRTMGNYRNKLNFQTGMMLNDKQLKQNLDEVIGHHNVVGVHVKDPQDKES